MSEVNHSIAGDWLGHYLYDEGVIGSCFEAIFLESGGYIEGSILDGGQLGEAFVSGTFEYPNLRFTKKYRRAGLEPVNYIGSMSEDGQTISGSWWIDARGEGAHTSGTWTASRTGGHTEHLPEILSEELTLSSTI
jgi:hypothetical protein